MRAFGYAWSLPVTWQRWRSHHSNRHVQKAHDTRKPYGSVFYRSGVMADWSFTLREYALSTFFCSCDLDVDLDTMTFIYELNLYSLEITGCANMNLLRQDFRKLSSDRQTDRQTQPSENRSKIGDFALTRSLWSKISGTRGRPPTNNFCTDS